MVSVSCGIGVENVSPVKHQFTWQKHHKVLKTVENLMIFPP